MMTQRLMDNIEINCCNYDDTKTDG